MRRRIRSAAFPVHRHALPQLVVDGLLVALAYFLAFWLRFEGDFDAPQPALRPSADRHDRLGGRGHAGRAGGVRPVPAAVAVHRPARLRGRAQGRVRGHRRRGGRSSRCCTRLQCAHDASTGPGHPARPQGALLARSGRARWRCRPASSRCSSCSAWRCSSARASPCSSIVEGRIRSIRAGKGAREVLIVGGGEGGRLVVRELMRNPELGLTPGRLPGRRPAQAGDQGRARPQGAGQHRRRSGPRAGRGGARRGRHRHPLGPGRAARARRRGLPRARDPGADDADRVRAAARRVGPAARHPPAARGPRRGHARPRARPRGAPARRRLPGRRDRDGDRRRRLDRLRAVPPDRPRGPAPPGARRPRRGQPVRDPPRARGGPPHPHRRARPGRLQGGGAHARGARRAPTHRSSSTPPPTSTSR